MLLRNKINNYISRGTIKVPWLTITIALIALFLFVLGPDKNSCFIFNKTDVCAGEIWRLFTGQLIHNNFDHLFWDVFAFIVLGSTIEIACRKKFILSFLLSSISVCIWMFVVEKGYVVYYGLSGLLNGLLVMAVFAKWAETKNKWFLTILPAAAIKMLYEMATKNVFFIDPSIATIPGTHLAGFLMGMILVIINNKYYLSHIKIQRSNVVEC